MRKVIDGKVYDTKTAEHVCKVRCSTNDRGSFDWHDTDMYRSPKGTYFLAGQGGARSMWSEVTGQNSWGPGSGLRLVEMEEARHVAEDAGLDADEMEAAGFAVEEG